MVKEARMFVPRKPFQLTLMFESKASCFLWVGSGLSLKTSSMFESKAKSLKVPHFGRL